MFRVTEKQNQNAVPGALTEYICTSVSDIDYLPRFGIAGKQRDSAFDNAPCAYGSTAMVCDGTSTVVYILTPNNEWVKM